MKFLLVILIICSGQVFAQEVFQVHEVEKAAEPAGGITFLNQFINANLQIPIKSAAKGMNARVFVKGVIEIDGSMSRLEVIRSVDSLIDQEALRVLGLYKAWKPALIKEKPVRQVSVFPVIFRTAPIPEFDSTENALIEYFDKNHTSVSDPNKYRFRNMIPVDERGFVRADISYQELVSGKWKTLKNIPYQKTEFWAPYVGPSGQDSIKAFKIFAKTDNWDNAYEEVILQADGKLLSHRTYPGSGRPPSSGKFYFITGVLQESQQTNDGLVKTTDWYDNGQIRSVLELGGGKGTIVKNVWERDGTQIVKDGNGWAKIKGNSYRGKIVFEEGQVVEGNRSGKWLGKFADSTVVYEEFYNAGKLEKGQSNFGKQLVTYDTGDISQPQFKGGLNKMYQFLGENISYPRDASASKITGRVVVSFVVQEDGTLNDYLIEQSVMKSLDNEALRVIKKMSGLWEPATQKGEKIRVRYKLPINFDTN